MKRILLVKPDSQLRVVKRLRAFLHLEPLGLEHLAGSVPDGNEVRILDLTVERRPRRALREVLRRFQPHLVGVTAFSNQRDRAQECIAAVHRECPAAITVLGGHHATILPEDCRMAHLDALVRGEGCAPFRLIVERLDLGLEAILQIPNVHAPDATEFGSIPVHPGIDQLPRPRRDLIDATKYFCVWSSPRRNLRDSLLPRVTSMRTSAGCAYACSFCIVPELCGRKYSPRDTDDIVDELRSIATDYVYLVDDETFLSHQHMRELAEKIRAAGIEKHFVSWARSDTITRHPELFELWHEIGLDIVYVGLESTNDKTLEQLNKRATLAHNEEAIRILDEIGITLHPAFMVMPDFEVEDFEALSQYVQSMPPVEATFTVYSPSPGTEDWARHREEFICDAVENYDCMHTILPTRLPLREFYRHFSALTVRAMARNPLRVNRVPVNPLELAKIVWQTKRYVREQKRMWKDYDRAHW